MFLLEDYLKKKINSNVKVNSVLQSGLDSFFTQTKKPSTTMNSYYLYFNLNFIQQKSQLKLIYPM